MSSKPTPPTYTTPQPGGRYPRQPADTHGKEITSPAEPNDDRAPMNRVFVCQVCGNAYMDRAAKEPVAIAVSRYILRDDKKRHIHPVTRQPITADSVSVTKDELWVVKEAVVPATDAAGACCPNHSRLMDAPLIRVALDTDRQYRIVGGVVRE